MKKFFVRTISGAALAFAALLVPFVAAQAMTISPPTFDYGANPGDTLLDVIKMYNEGTQPVTIYPIVKNFTADKEETGQPKFYDADQNPDGTALAKWITVDTKPITLKPQERGNLPFAINVPKTDAQPGGHYGTILLSTTPPTEGGKVSIASQIGVLIFMNVSGKVNETATVSEFGFKNKELWYNYLPIDFFLRFENDGNTHLRPTGNLVITNWWGHQVASIKVNEDFHSVLPRSIRKFEFGWQKDRNTPGESELKKEWRNFGFGKYKAMLILTYGSKNQVLTETREFTVWPWRLMSIAGAALVLLILILTVGVKLYNKGVIKRYERMKEKK